MKPYFYLDSNHEIQGPLTLEQLKKMTTTKAIGFATQVCPQGGSEWKPLYSIPASEYAQEEKTEVEVSDKKILPAFLLCFFLGWLGVHAFYSGQKKQGLIFLFLNAFGIVGNLILPIIAAVVCWIALIVFWISDLIRLLVGSYKDGEGRVMTEWS